MTGVLRFETRQGWCPAVITRVSGGLIQQMSRLTSSKDFSKGCYATAGMLLEEVSAEEVNAKRQVQK